MTSAVSSAVELPYVVVVPYSTCVSDARSVVHAIVAALPVIADEVTPEITGGATATTVKLPDTVVSPKLFVERTR